MQKAFVSLTVSASSSDIEFFKTVYASARNKYKPSPIRILLIAEAPSNSLERFFYFEDVKKHDSLFLEIMGVLYPDLKKHYLFSGRESYLKEELLQCFQEDGYWLLDLCEIPFSISNNLLEDYIPSLLERLKKYINQKTPIILIKSTLYDLCYPLLISHGYKVSKERVPFPGSGQQGVFRNKFLKAINSF